MVAGHVMGKHSFDDYNDNGEIFVNSFAALFVPARNHNFSWVPLMAVYCQLDRPYYDEGGM